MDLVLKLAAAAAITFIVGWLFAVAIDRIKGNLTKRDD